MRKLTHTLLAICLLLISTTVLAETAAAPIVFADSAGYQSQIGRVLGVLLLMLVAVFAVVWLMKKIGYTGNAMAGGLSVKACLPLSNKEKLYVVQVGEEQLLIGVGAGAITALKNLDKPIDKNNTKPLVDSEFSKKLHTLMKGVTTPKKMTVNEKNEATG